MQKLCNETAEIGFHKYLLTDERLKKTHHETL